MKRAICAGSFDPPTYGHLDVIQRSANLFDEIIVAVGINTAKPQHFSVEERVRLLRDALEPLGMDNVNVEAFDGLLVEYARKKKVNVLIRGLRTEADFEFEFQMVQTNKTLAPEIECVLLLTDPRYMYISSSLLKEVAQHGGDLSKYVPGNVETALKQKFS